MQLVDELRYGCGPRRISPPFINTTPISHSQGCGTTPTEQSCISTAYTVSSSEQGHECCAAHVSFSPDGPAETWKQPYLASGIQAIMTFQTNMRNVGTGPFHVGVQQTSGCGKPIPTAACVTISSCCCFGVLQNGFILVFIIYFLLGSCCPQPDVEAHSETTTVGPQSLYMLPLYGVLSLLYDAIPMSSEFC